MDTIAVKFVRSNSPYTVGEIASFNPDKARELVERGVAVYYKDLNKRNENEVNTTVEEVKEEKTKRKKLKKPKNRMIDTEQK